LIDRRLHSSELNVRSYRAAECDNEHYLVLAKFKEKLAVSKQRSKRFYIERFNLMKLNYVEGIKQYHGKVSNRFEALEDFYDDMDNNSAW
jgi:DUF1365 family protein